MKEFLFKIIIFIFLVASITILINSIYLMKKSDSGNEVDKFQAVPENIQICNLGSSHGVHGYYYEDLEDQYTCFNFALDSQFLSYDKRILEVYQENLAPGGVAIIDISFFACWGYPETEGDPQFETKNRRYYKFLPKKSIKKYDLYTDIVFGKMSAISDDPILVAKVLLKSKNNSTEIKSYPQMDRVVDVSKLAEDTAMSCQRHIFLNKRDENGKLFINEEEVQALSDIVKICREHSVTPLFITLPYLKEYTDTINREDPNFYGQFYEWIYSTAEKLNVEYFDYSLDERFIYDYSLFYNGDHMNSKGARKFTNILYEEVLRDKLNDDIM